MDFLHAVALVGPAAWCGLAGLTAVGQHRRGGALLLAALAAPFFPVTWVVWYVADGVAGERRSV